VTLSVAATGAGTLTYAWYEKPKNLNSAVRGTRLATTATYSPVVTAWGMRSYYCVVSNGIDSITSSVADVAIGCGAKTVDGGWISFMCQNLGAAPAPTDLNAVTFATDTTSSDAKGWLFQWGRAADGHQWRSSELARVDTISDLSNKDQFVVADSGYGKFIIGLRTVNQNDWRNAQWDILWRHLYDQSNVCPSGWHVPTSGDWAAIYAGGQYWSSSPGAATANNWAWLNPAAGAGGYAIRPDGSTTTLFLPAAGNRDATSGAFFAVGTSGNYWSATTYGDFSFNLFFSSGGVGPAYFNTRVLGFSVRCVAEI
jgi:uncharacterized protein (TIGR02145 family)